MKYLKYILPLLFCNALAFGGTPLDSTPVNQALKSALNSTGKWNQIQFSDGTTQTTASSGSTFNGGTITTNLQVVGSITANALAVPPTVTTVTYVNGTTTVTWANINTPQTASLTLTGATCTVNMTGGGTASVHRIFVIQDGTGTRTVTWATATVFFSGGSKPILSAAAGAKDELEFVCLDGVNYYCVGFSPDIK